MTDPRFVSYAQNAEDVVLARALRPDDQPGFWIDVGAADPIVDSVTAAFSERGWTGINIDPCPIAHAALCEARPLDVNLQFALGEKPGFAKLYPGPAESPGLSTLVPEVAELFGGDDVDGPAPEEVEVRRLADVVAQYAPSVVDFLKVDVEGFEREVLAGADWATFRPRIVVVEATLPGTSNPTHGEWEPMLLGAGYRFVLFDGLNRFYAAEGEDEIAGRLAAPASVLDDFVPQRWRTEFETAEIYARSLEVHLAALEAQHEAVVARFEREQHDLARAHRVVSDGAELLEFANAELRDDLAAIQVRAARAMADADRLAREVAAIEATRTFRYTARMRTVYSRIRRIARMAE